MLIYAKYKSASVIFQKNLERLLKLEKKKKSDVRWHGRIFLKESYVIHYLLCNNLLYLYFGMSVLELKIHISL